MRLPEIEDEDGVEGFVRLVDSFAIGRHGSSERLIILSSVSRDQSAFTTREGCSLKQIPKAF